MNALLNIPGNHHKQYLSQNVIREWLHNPRIVIYSIRHYDLYSQDLWTQAIIEDIVNWPAGGAYLAVYDLAQSRLKASSQTPFDEISLAMPAGMRGRYGLITTTDIDGRLMYAQSKLFIQGRPDMAIEGRMFAGYTDALRWVLNFLDVGNYN